MYLLTCQVDDFFYVIKKLKLRNGMIKGTNGCGPVKNKHDQSSSQIPKLEFNYILYFN